MSETKESISHFLAEQDWHAGWSMGKPIWWKRWKSAPRCQCNDDKEGIQVVVTASEWEDRVSYEIDATGQKPDGVWVHLSAYSISADEIRAALNIQAGQLVAAWTQLATSCQHTQAAQKHGAS